MLRRIKQEKRARKEQIRRERMEKELEASRNREVESQIRMDTEKKEIEEKR